MILDMIHVDDEWLSSSFGIHVLRYKSINLIYL